ncbi:hypothetical protein [Ralstonia solanacearum]|nr:hypothetical protein [Ralstonia solanacearum]
MFVAYAAGLGFDLFRIADRDGSQSHIYTGIRQLEAGSALKPITST